MTRPILLVGASLLMASSAFAQEGEQANVGRIYWSWARPGQVQQYEAGSKRHNEFHKMKKDPWSWYTWQAISGNRAGQYVIGTFWHQWKDFDNMPVPTAEDDADYFKNIEPYEANWRGEHVVFMPEHSQPPASMDPTPMVQLWQVQVKPDKVEQYLNAIKKIPGAIQKAGVDWKYSFWSIADGATGAAFYISFPLNNWADRASDGPPFEEVLTKAYGRSEAHAIMDALAGAEERRTSMILVLRTDLSYMPAP